MENDLLYFVKNVLMIENKNLNEVTIAIELKNLIEENDTIYIQLEYEGQILEKIKVKERKK